MNRVLLSVLALLGSFCLAADPPNIVYIMSDELAYYEVGYNGQELIQTPRIDRMAREGIVFHRAYAGRRSAPRCAATS